MHALSLKLAGVTPADAVRATGRFIARTAYLAACALAVCIVIAIVGAFAVAQASHADLVFNPVITNQVNSNVHWDRSDKALRFCWTWSGTKARDAEPSDFTHIMIRREVNGSVNRVYLPVTPMDNGVPRPFETSRTAASGQSFSNALCSIVPPWASERTTFDVEGFVLYPGSVSLLGQVLWNVRQHIPTIHHEGEAL